MKTVGWQADLRPEARWIVAAVLGMICVLANGASAIGRPVGDTQAAFPKSTPATLAELRAMERRVKNLVARVSPAVVAVAVGIAAGSGVVISEDGFVLCAAHVCGRPNRPVQFTFPDGRTARGETLGTDHEMDSGLMKITDTGPWPHVEMGNRDDVLPGDWVLALGHPGGFDPQRPVVARLGRIIRSGSMLQTDCPLIGGDSGGPLFDLNGRVVGIHSRISDSTTENFHVPVRSYVETWARLVLGENWGYEEPPMLATIRVRGVDHPEGCRLDRVTEGGPGFRAGLIPGDVVVRVNDECVPDSDCLTHCIQQTNPGDEVTVTVIRDQKEISIKVKTEPRRGWGRRPRPGR